MAIESIAALLCPWLGTRLVAQAPTFIEALEARFHAFIGGSEDLKKVAGALDSLLFSGLREMTRGTMRVLLDDGQYMRVRVSDCTVLADELLYLLLETLPRDEMHFQIVREYSLADSSLSALRALITLYPDFQAEEELTALRYVVKTCHPPFRWRAWLS